MPMPKDAESNHRHHGALRRKGTAMPRGSLASLFNGTSSVSNSAEQKIGCEPALHPRFGQIFICPCPDLDLRLGIIDSRIEQRLGVALSVFAAERLVLLVIGFHDIADYVDQFIAPPLNPTTQRIDEVPCIFAYGVNIDGSHIPFNQSAHWR